MRLCSLPEAISIPGPLLAAEQLLQGCKRVVDRYVAGALSPADWNQLLKGPEENPQLTVRLVHGRIQHGAHMIIERLLRVKKADGGKDVTVADSWHNWQVVVVNCKLI